MSTSEIVENYNLVQQDAVAAGAEGVWSPSKASKMGYQIVIDFWTQMAIEGRAYQVRAGNIATPLACDTVITDTAAQMSVDAPTGITVIPAAFGFGILDTAAATTLQVAIKAVGAASTAGTAFVPLPLYQGGAASVSTGRAMTDGGVTVAAEAVTTTRRLFEYVALQTASATVLVTGGLVGQAAISWIPRTPYIGNGVCCVYVQAGTTTQASSHYGHLDYVELPTFGVS